VLVRIPTANTSDDELLNVDNINETASQELDDAGSGGGGDSENIVITLGCLARWHRGRPKPCSESSVNTIVNDSWYPANTADVVVTCDDDSSTSMITPRSDLGVVRTTDNSLASSAPVCDRADSETGADDHLGHDDDDDRSLLIC